MSMFTEIARGLVEDLCDDEAARLGLPAEDLVTEAWEETEAYLLAARLQTIWERWKKRVKACPAHRANSTQQCGTLFVKTGRQRYCSQLCQSRMNMETTRKRKKAKPQP